MSQRTKLVILAIVTLVGGSAFYYGANIGQVDAVPYEISIKDHRFIPDQLQIPPNKRIKLTVKNLDNNIEEFESHDIGLEKIIPAKNSATIFFGPLLPGTYAFFGEMHEDTAQGKFIVDAE